MDYETVLKEIFIGDISRIIWKYVMKPSNRIAYMFEDTPCDKMMFSRYPDIERRRTGRSIIGTSYHFILHFKNGICRKWYWFPNEGGEGRVFLIEA